MLDQIDLGQSDDVLCTECWADGFYCCILGDHLEENAEWMSGFAHFISSLMDAAFPPKKADIC